MGACNKSLCAPNEVWRSLSMFWELSSTRDKVPPPSPVCSTLLPRLFSLSDTVCGTWLVHSLPDEHFCTVGIKSTIHEGAHSLTATCVLLSLHNSADSVRFVSCAELLNYCSRLGTSSQLGLAAHAWPCISCWATMPPAFSHLGAVECFLVLVFCIRTIALARDSADTGDVVWF